MFHSLQFRINLISLLSGVLIAAGLAAAGARLIANQVSEELQAHSHIAANELVNKIQRLKNLGLGFDAIIGLDEECRDVVAKNKKLVFAGIYDLEGRLRFSSGPSDIAWSGAGSGQHGIQTSRNDTHFFFTHPIDDNSEANEGFVVVAAERALERQTMISILGRFVVLAAVLILIGLTLHFLWLRRSVVEPLGVLVQQVKAVDPAKFEGRLGNVDIAKGEIGELAGAFSKLLCELDKAQQEVMKQASRALKAEKQLNKTIVQSSPLAIYTRDRQGLVTGWNAACERVFGWTEAEVLGKPLPTIPPDKLDESTDMRRQLLQGQPNLQIEAQRLRRDGSTVDLLITLSPLYDESGDIEGVLAIATDITERKAAEKRIEFLAHHDALTGLPNRRLIQARFEQAASFAERDGRKVGLVFIDLDHFKSINDTLGHGVGDAYLKEIAQRLGSVVRSTDILSRQGGDEFLLVLSSLADTDDIPPILTKLAEKLKEPVWLSGSELAVSMSIGIAVYPDDGRSFDDLLKKADMAMYQAKQQGRNTYSFYREDLDVGAVGRHSLRSDLQRGLERHEFVLHYQPLQQLQSGRIVSMEALIRWNHPRRGMLPPSDFIPFAEENGMIVPIGNWVLSEACRQLAQWRQAGLTDIAVAVNLSPLQLMNGRLEQFIPEQLAEFDLPAHLLELELTESLLIQPIQRVQETLSHLKALGVRIVIDDFGAAYSSLQYLKKLDIDKLKIDKTYIESLDTEADDQAIVAAIVQMARRLDVATIAEGIETVEVLQHLNGLACDEGQGYYFAYPMAAEEAESYVRDAMAGWNRKDCA